MENKLDFLTTLLEEYVGDVEFQDDKVIINLKKVKDDTVTNIDKEKINQLSDETFTDICEYLGKDKVKELSDNENYKEFINLATDWIDNKINELQEELEMLNSED